MPLEAPEPSGLAVEELRPEVMPVAAGPTMVVLLEVGNGAEAPSTAELAAPDAVDRMRRV